MMTIKVGIALLLVLVIPSLQEETKDRKGAIPRLITKYNETSDRLAELDTKVKDFETIVEDLRKELADTKADLQKYLSRVSFQVILIEDPVPVSHHEILQFDEVTLNDGKAYNPTSGKFVAHVTGMYFFWANIMSKNGDWFAIYLVKDGKKLIRSYTGAGVAHGTATISYMLELKTGDHVWFQNEEHGGKQTIIQGKQFSSYGGTLLYT